jgi:hypothetical protein
VNNFSMSKLKGLGEVRHAKGKGLKGDFKMSELSGLADVRAGKKRTSRQLKGQWSEYVEAFNRTSGSERQAPNYRGSGKG